MSFCAKTCHVVNDSDECESFDFEFPDFVSSQADGVEEKQSSKSVA